MSVTRNRTILWRAAVLALACVATTARAQDNDADLRERVERLVRELEAVKAELARRDAQAGGPGATVAPSRPTTSPSSTSPDAAFSASAAQATGINGDDAPQSGASATVLSSYGELTYNRPHRGSSNTQADLRRFVLGLSHRFDERTKLVAELEYEHAVVSADDRGEAEVEQAYIEHQLSNTLAARAGLFLIPLGLLNENHEPTAFYGVERNLVETAIIPTTWREGGVQLVAQFDPGWTLQGGISTGFDVNRWDATTTDSQAAPLNAIHQELSLARARDLSAFGAINWRGVPGLRLGGGVFTGGASHGVTGAPRSRVTLWSLQAHWTPGPWDLSAVAARGNISGTAELNTPWVGNISLLPKRFDGAYLQAAYRFNVSGAGAYALSTLAPFLRLESVNTGRRYADLAPGLTPAPLPTTRIITAGANFALNREVVLKADVQWFRPDSAANRFNLGLGWSF